MQPLSRVLVDGASQVKETCVDSTKTLSNEMGLIGKSLIFQDSFMATTMRTCTSVDRVNFRQCQR